MIKPFDLPNIIPVFPLAGALLLPRARLPLNLFEPRYLQMFDDALKTDDRLIGMVQPNEVEGRDDIGLHSIGCVGRITQFSETEGGSYMVTLGVFRAFVYSTRWKGLRLIAAVKSAGQGLSAILATWKTIWF